jgi:hypothetical protein
MTCHLVRTETIEPYLPGRGPSYRLTIGRTGAFDGRGVEHLCYELVEISEDKNTLLFSGDQFSPSPMFAQHDARVVTALMSFLTLKPGDTDAEYFTDYTPSQLAFADEHGEAVFVEVVERFGED